MEFDNTNFSLASLDSVQVENIIFNSQKLAKAILDDDLPSVIFAMRYADNAGYVWNAIAQGRDNAASHLANLANCFIGYPQISKEPTYTPRNLFSVELNAYDMSEQGKKALEAFIRNNRVKVMVFMSALPSTIDLPFLRKLGVRTINTENDGFDSRKRDTFLKSSAKFLLRRVLKKQLHDMHLANARSQQAFLSSYAHIPQSRLSLLTDGVDCHRFKPGDKSCARHELSMAQSTFWVISVAQARPGKRLDYIIRAARDVIDSRPGVDIGFIYVGDGDGPLTSELKRLAADLHLGDSFRFAGRQDNLVPYYQAADLLVHASERESFGLAVVEGMACGLPVVASAAAGPSETIVHDETGSLVEIEDFGGFVAQILRYVDNRELTLLHGRNAVQRANDIYSLERYGRELAQYIRPYL